MIETYEGISPAVDPTAWIHQTAVVIGGVSLGSDCSVWPNATLRADEGRIVVGAKSNIQDGCTLHMTGGQNHTVVGERVTVGHNAILHGCTIGDDCLVGMGSLVMDHVEVGDGCFIGAGTLIPPRKIIPPGSMVFGNPFQVVRPCEDAEREWIDYAWRHYRDNARKYAAAAARAVQGA